jgi:putative ABC transport system substrate-binding protein
MRCGIRGTARRLGWAGCLFAMALGFAAAVVAQPVPKRIAWLGYGSPPSGRPNVQDFEVGLRDRGYVDRQNILIEYQFAKGDPAQLSHLAAELMRLKVDVIVTSGEPAALAAQRATSTIPIVTTEFGFDPVKAGLVASLGKPGANVTGLASQSEELWEKRLATLKELVPKLARVSVLWNPANPGNVACLAEIQRAARSMSLQVVALEARDGNALERVLAGVGKESNDALAICWDAVTLDHARTIADFALKRRIPTVAPLKEFVEAGCLMSYGLNLPAHRRRIAYYVDRILKGDKPAGLAVEQPTAFDLVISQSTSRSLGIAIPPNLLLLVDELLP